MSGKHVAAHPVIMSPRVDSPLFELSNRRDYWVIIVDRAYWSINESSRISAHLTARNFNVTGINKLRVQQGQMRCSRRKESDRLACWRNGRRFSSMRSIRERVSSTRQLILESPSKRSVGNQPDTAGQKVGRAASRAAWKKFPACHDKSEGQIVAPSMAHGTWQFLPYKTGFTGRLVSTCDRNDGDWMILSVANVGGKWESGSLSRL